MNDLFLAIDQGGHASRALVIDNRGQVIAAAEVPITTLTPRPGWVEHDADEIIDSVRLAVDRAVARLGNGKHRLRAAALATQRSSIVCWDRENGRALSPIISWQDRRQAQWMTGFAAQADAIHRRTGLYPSPHYGAAKLRWCLDNLAAVQDAQRQRSLAMGPMASFVLYHLARERPLLADPANASRTLLWNLERRDWDDSLCHDFGVHPALLPRCVDSRFAFGTLVSHGVDIPIALMTGDQPAALFAAGPPATDTVYINMGTGAFIQRPQTTARRQPPLLTGIAHADAASCLYTLEGTVNGAGQALRWFQQTYGVAALDAHLPAWLDEVKESPLFINSVAGLGSPYWQAQLEPEFCGADEADLAAKAVAVVESIAFLIQANLGLLAHTEPRPAKILLSGGLSRLDGLCRRIANLSGLATFRSEIHEATALGLFHLLRPERDVAAPNTEAIAVTHDPGLSRRYREWNARMTQVLQI